MPSTQVGHAESATCQCRYVLNADIPDSSTTCLPLCILRQKAKHRLYKESKRYGDILALPTMCRRLGLGLFLISPWVSLFGERGYAGKADPDLLDASTLRRWTMWLVNDAPTEVIRTYLEFSTSNPEGPGLEQILPSNIRGFAGGDEIFLENIKILQHCTSCWRRGTAMSRTWRAP